jgi:hypothetical protein
MIQATAITEIIQTLADVEYRFNITRTESDDFFPEWYENLPEITDLDRESLSPSPTLPLPSLIFTASR